MLPSRRSALRRLVPAALSHNPPGMTPPWRTSTVVGRQAAGDRRPAGRLHPFRDGSIEVRSSSARRNAMRSRWPPPRMFAGALTGRSDPGSPAADPRPPPPGPPHPRASRTPAGCQKPPPASPPPPPGPPGTDPGSSPPWQRREHAAVHTGRSLRLRSDGVQMPGLVHPESDSQLVPPAPPARDEEVGNIGPLWQLTQPTVETVHAANLLD